MTDYPDAVVVMTADEVAADHERWLAERRTGIGGSDASKVIGLNAWSSPYQLWLDKMGLATETPDNPAMEWGRRLEPVMRGWFADTTGIPVTLGGLLRHRDRAWQLFSPDGRTADDGLLEIKTTGEWTDDAEKWLDGEIPDHAELQLQHGLAVTGLTHAHAIALVGGQRPVHLHAERDEKLITTLTDVEHRFWHDNVLGDVPPPIDGLPATGEAIRRRYAHTDGSKITSDASYADLLDQIAATKLRIKLLEGDKDELENRIRAKFGHAETMLIHGEEVATLRANGTFARNRFAADHPALYEEYLRHDLVFDEHAFRDDHPDLHTAYRARVLRAAPKGPRRG